MPSETGIDVLFHVAILNAILDAAFFHFATSSKHDSNDTVKNADAVCVL